MRNFRSHKIVNFIAICDCLYLKVTGNGLKVKNSSIIQDIRLKLNKLQ